MFAVSITAEAQRQFGLLPLTIQQRMREIFARLVNWPAVSGVKALRGDLRSAFRIRTGDWRMVFTVNDRNSQVTVFRIDNRRDVYRN